MVLLGTNCLLFDASSTKSSKWFIQCHSMFSQLMECPIAKCLFQLSLTWRHRHVYYICIFKMKKTLTLWQDIIPLKQQWPFKKRRNNSLAHTYKSCMPVRILYTWADANFAYILVHLYLSFTVQLCHKANLKRSQVSHLHMYTICTVCIEFVTIFY